MKMIFLRTMLITGIFFLKAGIIYPQSLTANKPNIILIMADDLGWGDMGFNGNPHIKTPELDEMAARGLQFNRFYAAAPVCSPTRGSVLTGRHPGRYGIHFANVGHLKKEEFTIAEALKTQGYATGHFGKWHLGTLTKTIKDGRRGGKENNDVHYSPPWVNGFDVSFSTEVAIPTWNPMENQAFASKYWTGPDQYEKENLSGDDSRVIMDRAIPFIKESAKSDQPFLAVIWFHTPHSPVVAGPDYRKMYEGYDENKQHYYGCITAMDTQVGRLRVEIRKLKIEENTMIFFTSDNGPAGRGGGINQEPGERQQGSAGLFRGRKGSLYEGGIRVPGLVEWPAMIQPNRKTNVPASTSDYFATILSLVGFEVKERPHPLDGIDISPLIRGKAQKRGGPIAFKSYKQRAYMDDQFKIYSPDDGKNYELYDLLNDPYEKKNIVAQHPEKMKSMIRHLNEWIASCEKSEQGKDYAID